MEDIVKKSYEGLAWFTVYGLQTQNFAVLGIVTKDSVRSIWYHLPMNVVFIFRTFGP